MRLNSLSWAVIVIASTLSAWNLIEYEVAFPSRSAAYRAWESKIKWEAVPGVPAESWTDTAKRWVTRRSKYVGREVPVVGVAIAALLIVNRRENKRSAS